MVKEVYILLNDRRRKRNTKAKVILPDAKLSVAKTIEAIANEKAKKLNGKIKSKANT